MSETDDAVSGFKASLLAKVVQIGVNGILILLLTRVFLTTEEYGLLYLAISIFGMAVFFSRMGFAKSAARYVTEYRERNPSKIPFIVRRSLLFNLIAIAVVASIVVFFRDQIAAWFGEPELISLLSLGLLFITAQTLQSYSYFLCQGFNRVNLSATVLIVANLGILVFVLVFLGLGLGIYGALLGYIAGYGLGATVGLVVLYRLTSQTTAEPVAADDTSDSETKGLSRRLLEYSLPLTITGAASILFKRVDIILVGAILNPIAVGYYVLAKQLTEFVTAPASSLGFALAPSYGESKSADNIRHAANVYKMTFKYTLLFYIPAAAGIALVADPAIRHVFGDGYLGAIPIVQVLSVFVIFQSITKITDDALDFLGRARHRAISKGGAATINFGLNLALIPTIGAIGAAVSTVISYGILVTVNVYLINSELSVSVTDLFSTVARVCAIAIGMSIIVVLFLPYVSSIVSLLAIVVLGAVVWFALAVRSGLLDVRWVATRLS